MSNVTRTIEIFRAGRHRTVAGVEIAFSEAEVAHIASAYDPTKHEAPAVVGHPALDGPAYGWIKGLKADGGSLKAEVSLTPSFAEVVGAGHYKKVSAAFYTPGQSGNPAPDGYYLRHLGFLGAQPPAIKGLEPFAFADGVADGLAVVDIDLAFAEAEASDITGLGRVLARLAGMVERIRDHIAETVGAEEADKIADPRELDWLRSDASELVGRASERMRVSDPAHFSEHQPDPNSEEPEVTTPNKDAEKQLADREAAIALREQQLADRERTASRAADVAFAESLIAAGKLPALQKDNLVAVLGALPRGDDTESAVQFAEADEGGATKTTSMSAHSAFMKMVEAAPSIVAFGEHGAGSEAVDIDDGDTETAVSQLTSLANEKVAAAKAAGQTLAFAEAIEQVKKETSK